MLFIIVWKVAGELVKPKYITKGLKRPRFVRKAAFPDADVIKAPLDIEFREEPGSFQTVDEVVDQRDWVPVLHGHRIEHPVILYEPEHAVLLFDEEDRRGHR
jgi:hypothetical protein